MVFVCLCRKVTRGHCPYHETGRCTRVKVGTEIFIQPPVLFTSPQIISGALRALPPLTYSVRTFAGRVRNRSLRLAFNPHSRNRYRTENGRLSPSETRLAEIIFGNIIFDIRNIRVQRIQDNGSVYVRVHCQMCYLLCEQVRAWHRAARAQAICVIDYIKQSCPHLLYLEALADHLAGDRGLVSFLDSLRHGCDTRSARASRAAVTAVLNSVQLFLVFSRRLAWCVIRPNALGIWG